MSLEFIEVKEGNFQTKRLMSFKSTMYWRYSESVNSDLIQHIWYNITQEVIIVHIIFLVDKNFVANNL